MEDLEDLKRENQSLKEENQKLREENQEYESYNYLEAVEDDVRDYIEENGGILGLLQDNDYENCEDLETFKSILNDNLVDYDGVTGAASGSYTINMWKAEQNLSHNLDLLAQVCEEWGYNANELLRTPEECDVLIRQYLLSEAINNVLNDEDDFDNAKNELEYQENL